MKKSIILMLVIVLAFSFLVACSKNSNTPSGSSNNSEVSTIPADNEAATNNPFYNWNSENYKNEMGGYSVMYSPQFGSINEFDNEISILNISGKSFFDVYVWDASFDLERITKEWFIDDCINNLGFIDVNILTYEVTTYEGYECLDITCTWKETELGSEMTFTVYDRYIRTNEKTYEIVCRDGSDGYIYISNPYENFASYFEYMINNFRID